jgi:hypothetical protein
MATVGNWDQVFFVTSQWGGASRGGGGVRPMGRVGFRIFFVTLQWGGEGGESKAHGSGGFQKYGVYGEGPYPLLK